MSWVPIRQNLTFICILLYFLGRLLYSSKKYKEIFYSVEGYFTGAWPGIVTLPVDGTTTWWCYIPWECCWSS